MYGRKLMPFLTRSGNTNKSAVLGLGFIEPSRLLTTYNNGSAKANANIISNRNDINTSRGIKTSTSHKYYNALEDDEFNRENRLETYGSAVTRITVEEMLKARVHLGHHISCWNPKMKPFILGKRDGIHIIDLDQTILYFRRALNLLRHLARDGVRIMFVSSRPEHEMIVRHAAIDSGCYYSTREWISGAFTNEKQVLGKEEPLPEFIVCFSTRLNNIATLEASQQLIPSMGIIDTDTNPEMVTYPIFGNDDSVESMVLYTKYMVEAINEGRAARKTGKPL